MKHQIQSLLTNYKLHVPILFFVLTAIYVSPYVSYGKTYSLSLQDVIDNAQQKSSEKLSARNNYLNNYWQYRNYKASMLPTLSLSATIPGLNRSISSITLSDGSEKFVERYLSNSTVNVSLNQSVPFTGGQLSLNTQLLRVDVLGDSSSTSYLSNPITLSYSQPLFSFNSLKWDMKIQPIVFNEAKQRYIEECENVSISALNFFFDYYLAKINLEITEKNIENNDTLYKIAEGRYNLGKIAENELLQMELSVLNSRTSLENARISFESARFALVNFLGFEDDAEIILNTPEINFDFDVDRDKAVEEALSNRADAMAFERRLLESKRSVANAKAESGFSANLYAGYGLTKNADELKDAYSDTQNYQQLSLGIEIPIYDGGVGKGSVIMAESNHELLEQSIEKERKEFIHNIEIKVLQYNIQKTQLEVAAKSDSIAQKRYDVTKQRYLIGKIAITDLNLAQTERDSSQKSYISAMRNFWNYYYQLRKLTLYDFVDNKKIEYDLDSITE